MNTYTVLATPRSFAAKNDTPIKSPGGESGSLISACVSFIFVTWTLYEKECWHE